MRNKKEEVSYDLILENAMKLGQERHPDSPQHHHAAFANSVATLVTGWSGGFGGPSMREHWAMRAAKGAQGTYSFEDAVASVEDACYGDLSINHARMLKEEECFDDAPGEVKQAQKLLANYKAVN